jgi:predicted transcriptional regulator of viral defense system
MKFNKLSTIENLLFFTKEALRTLEPNNSSLDFNLKYWLKKGRIISLKNGMYVLKDRWEKEQNKQLYLEYLANKILEPSYLSGEYVLSKYALLAEAVYTITSITTQCSKSFTNNLGQFNYYSITPKLFTGYKTVAFDSATVLVANKEKALFDYLYLRFLKLTPINTKAIEELRINWENINTREFLRVKNYAKKARSTRIKKLISLIEKQYYD